LGSCSRGRIGSGGGKWWENVDNYVGGDFLYTRRGVVDGCR